MSLAPALVIAPAGRPAVLRRSRTVRILGEVALMVVLTLTLGFSWRDGAVRDDDLFAAASSPADATQVLISERGLRSHESLPSAGSTIDPPAPATPTARPVQLLIPALDVHRAVEGVGVNRSGVLNLPVNAWNAGWYKGGPVPGAPGDAVIEGHAGYPGKPMIFGRLTSLRPGDRIIVVLADHKRQLFVVGSMTRVAIGTAPPGMGEPYGPPRLTLITCTGYFDKDTYSYSQRLVLEASYVGPI